MRLAEDWLALTDKRVFDSLDFAVTEEHSARKFESMARAAEERRAVSARTKRGGSRMGAQLQIESEPQSAHVHVSIDEQTASLLQNDVQYSSALQSGHLQSRSRLSQMPSVLQKTHAHFPASSKHVALGISESSQATAAEPPAPPLDWQKANDAQSVHMQPSIAEQMPSSSQADAQFWSDLQSGHMQLESRLSQTPSVAQTIHSQAVPSSRHVMP